MRSFVAGFILIASTVSASAHTPDREEACRRLAQSVPASITVAKAVAVGADGCAFEGVEMALNPRMQVAIGRLTVQKLDPAGGELKAVPLALRLEARSLSFGPRSGDPLIDYVTRFAARPMDAVLDYTFDPANATLRLSEVGLDGKTVGHVRLSAEIVRLDPTGVASPSPSSIEQAALKSLRLRLDNDGFVEGFLAIPLASALLQGAADPAAQAAALKEQAQAALPVLLSNAEPATLAALRDFLAAFPHPDKPFELTIELPAPLGASDLLPILNEPTQIAKRLPPGSIKARYGE
jgi:hypothetical protein